MRELMLAAVRGAVGRATHGLYNALGSAPAGIVARRLPSAPLPQQKELGRAWRRPVSCVD